MSGFGGTFLGIDQSYSGFAIAWLETDELGQVTETETVLQKFDPKKYGTGIDRLNQIEDWLDEYLRKVGDVTHVCMEGYSMASKFGRESAGELGHAVKRTLWDHHGYPTIVSPSALKKFTTGAGNAKKQEMLLAVYKRWGVEFKNDNLADAYALAHVGIALTFDDDSRPKFQTEVLKGLTVETERFTSP